MNKHTILVIEDNEKNLKLVRALLIMADYHVLESCTAEEGIELAREYQPDLILMDIQLPGMNGLEATQIITTEPGLNKIPVVALSAHAMVEDQNKAIAAGCQGYISKPIDTRTFEEQILAFLRPRPSEPVPEKHPKSIPESFKGARVLMVDDNPKNIKLLEGILSHCGYELLSAGSGEQGLKQVEEHKPDLILLDIMMPDIDGYAFTKRIKTNPKFETIPIILITALGGHEDRIKGKDAGAEEFLTKPVNPIEVEARVLSMLKIKRYRDQLDLRKISQTHLFEEKDKPRTIKHEAGLTGKILLIDDDEKDGKLLENNLWDLNLDVQTLRSGSQALETLNQGHVDLAIVDILMPEMDGFEICNFIKSDQRLQDIQVLMTSCLKDTESKIKALDTGADDYLIKPWDVRELHARVKALLKKKKYIDQLKSQYESALSSAMTDGLTRLYNHIYFKRFLELELIRSHRQGHQTALLMIDIDDFKQINDSLGHAAGDEILREFGTLLKESIRDIDLAARYGGEEFAVVLPYSDKQVLSEVGLRICRQVEQMPIAEPYRQSLDKITASIGGAVYPDDAKDLDELIETADFMLYRAKKNGKNQVCIK